MGLDWWQRGAIKRASGADKNGYSLKEVLDLKSKTFSGVFLNSICEEFKARNLFKVKKARRRQNKSERKIPTEASKFYKKKVFCVPRSTKYVSIAYLTFLFPASSLLMSWINRSPFEVRTCAAASRTRCRELAGQCCPCSLKFSWTWWSPRLQAPFRQGTK